MNKILLVEDEPGIALVLEDSLRLEGHDVEVVSNGLAAGQRVRDGGFDLILLDGILPGKDGFDVCRDLRRAGFKTPIILLTARAQVEDRVRGLDLGANDYIVKPFSTCELMARVRRHLQREHDLRDDRKKLEEDTRAAFAVQERLFPSMQPPIPGLDYAAVCRPARGVSGDYYDFIPLNGGRLGLLVADVCGKGMPAALLGASLHAAVRAYAPSAGANCGEVLERANRLLFETTAPERYATVFYGVFDPSTNTLTYANAGQYPPWVVSGSSEARLESLTPPLGMFAEIPAAECVVQLQVGDWLLVASDGIPEARDPDGQEFGDDRLLARVMQNSESALALCSETIAAVTAFSENSPSDDLTLLAARVLAGSDEIRRDP
jgi:serine phosphatase RsbU (regulator of sigma subunit)